MYHATNQLLLGQEIIEGTTPAMTGADAIYAYDVAHAHEVDETEFRPVGDTFSKPITLMGGRRNTVTFGVDLKPGGATGGHPVPPPWDKPIRASGTRRWLLYEVNIGAITSGPVAHMAAYTSVAGSAGFIIGSYITGVPKILYWPTNGILIANADPITIGAATCTSSSVSTQNGYLYATTSRVLATANRGAWSGTPLVGEWLKGSPSGGVAKLLQIGNPVGGSSEIGVEPVPGLINLANGDTVTSQTLLRTCLLSSSAACAENYPVSMLYNIDGTAFISYGCRGNWKFDWKTKEVCRIEFSFQGYELATVDTPLVGGTSYNTTMPPRLVSANGSIDALSMPVAGISVDLQNVFAAIPDWNTPEGARVTRVVDRNPAGQIDFDLLPVAAHDFWTKWRLGTTVALKIRLGTAENAPFGNIGAGLWIEAPRVQYRKPALGNREGNANVVMDVGYRRTADNGNDEIFIICV